MLAQVVGGPAHLVGWSAGGIVALKRPQIAVIGTNYDYDGVMPVEMTLNLRFVQELSKAYIERSPDGDDVIEAARSTLVMGIS